MAREHRVTSADPGGNLTLTDGRQIVKNREQARDGVAALIRKARRRICVFAPVLDGYFYNTSEIANILSLFSARNRNNLARFLVEDGAQAVHDNIRIVQLCRRLSDFVKMRRVCEDHRGIKEIFIVIDDASYMHQQDITKPAWLFHVNARHEAMRLSRRFEEMWQHSLSLPDINTVGL